jgi:hypothetical protein
MKEHKKKAGEKRKDHASRFKTAKGRGDKKIQILDLWADMLVDVEGMIVDAVADNDEQDLALLRAARDELMVARADLQDNPSNWELIDLEHLQRRVMHLLLGVNPYTTNPDDWEV